jgi:hypothetical protein
MDNNTFSAEELKAAQLVWAHKTTVESGEPYWIDKGLWGNTYKLRCFIKDRPHGDVWYGERAISFEASERDKRFYASLFVPYKSNTSTQTFHSLEEAKQWVETHEIFDPDPYISRDWESKNVQIIERKRD